MPSPRRPKPLDAQGLMDYALQALSSRSLTTGELRTRLQKRAAQPEEVAPVLGRLRDAGYLNDRRFAESFTRLRVEDQGFGKFRVLRDLRGRRVAPELAEQTVAAAYRDLDETQLIDRYLRRKLRLSEAGPAISDPRRLASLYRQLLRAGFTAGKILEALRRLPAPAEWVEELEEVAEDKDAG